MNDMSLTSDKKVVKRVWSAYGTNEPYYSMITDEKFHSKNIAEHLDEFWESGKDSLKIIKELYEKYKTNNKNPRVLAYGCGVGRLMKAWGEDFGYTIEGCDISPSHLLIAKDILGEEYPLHLVEPGECPKEYDLIFSIMVLQHNRPELMKLCFRSIIEALNTGGLAILHAPYYIHSVKKSDETMEMNYVPKDEIMSLVEEMGAKLLACNEEHDICGGGIKNCIYVINK